MQIERNDRTTAPMPTYETDALIKFRSGKSFFGIILDCPEKVTDINNMKFIPNEWLKKYRETAHPSLVITLHESEIEMVDLSLK